ncbi:hypothetical protein R5R35_012275 [Gryllus longicercus]|uniref:Uncharacterized protein n=1 Tax=Gryllus longicercus TaxID=2509291 RepID=A0AAN9VQ70_9ORTH
MCKEGLDKLLVGRLTLISSHYWVCHSNLTHSYVVSKAPMNRCPTFGTEITVFHFTVECNEYHCKRTGLPENIKNCLDGMELALLLRERT